jgi:hypothetical protein
MFGPVPILRQRGGAIAPPLILTEKGMILMAEFTSAAIQTVAAGQNVPLTETSINNKPCIVHRQGAGIVTLRGLTSQNRALFRVSYGGNIAIPTGGTVEAISAALAINGEPLTSATATVTPAAVENYFNIYVSAQVCVPKGCCLTIAMENTSTQAVNFANSNLTVERIA